MTDREILDIVLDMHRAAPVQIDGEDVCQHCTRFTADLTAVVVTFPCPTRKTIEGARI